MNDHWSHFEQCSNQLSGSPKVMVSNERPYLISYERVIATICPFGPVCEIVLLKSSDLEIDLLRSPKVKGHGAKQNTMYDFL